VLNEAVTRWKAAPVNNTELDRAILADLLNELRYLLGQESVWGSTDFEVIGKAYESIDTCFKAFVDTGRRRSPTREHIQETLDSARQEAIGSKVENDPCEAK
jgi:hypothetical protein